MASASQIKQVLSEGGFVLNDGLYKACGNTVKNSNGKASAALTHAQISALEANSLVTKLVGYDNTRTYRQIKLREV